MSLSPWNAIHLLRWAGSFFNPVKAHASQLSKAQFVYGRLATRAVFFCAGIATAPWACFMPYVKTRLELNEMHYAALLLCYGLGAVIGMPLTGRLAARFGVRRMITLSMLLTVSAMCLMAYDDLTLPLAYCGVLLWGSNIGILDVSNNIHGACIEEMAGRHLMSSFHGFYTVGCLVAALYCAFMLHGGLHTFYTALSLWIATVALLIYAYPRLINTHGQGANAQATDSAPPTALPTCKAKWYPSYLTLTVVLCGMISLIMYLGEGMIYDWSAVYLITTASVDITIAAVGYLAFELAVAIMRFKGDGIVTRLGPLKLLLAGSIIGALSFAAIALTTNAYVMIALFFVAGLALANVVPVILSHTAQISGSNQGRALSFVGTCGYGGLLLGPAILGSIATLCGLSGMFIFTASLILLLGLMAIKILKPRT